MSDARGPHPFIIECVSAQNCCPGRSKFTVCTPSRKNERQPIGRFLFTKVTTNQLSWKVWRILTSALRFTSSFSRTPSLLSHSASWHVSLRRIHVFYRSLQSSFDATERWTMSEKKRRCVSYLQIIILYIRFIHSFYFVQDCTVNFMFFKVSKLPWFTLLWASRAPGKLRSPKIRYGALQMCFLLLLLRTKTIHSTVCLILWKAITRFWFNCCDFY